MIQYYLMENYIDIYCERLTPGLWAEPLNAITNAAFILAAFLSYLLAERKDALTKQSVTLITILTLIGIGSTLFHTFATKMTMLMDVVPILIYQIGFIWFYSLYVIRLNAIKTAGLFALFLILTVTSEMMPSHILNGSLGYLPAIMFLAGFGIWHARNLENERYTLLTAAGLFLISLTFRSIDMAVCQTLPIGTHFLWHCLNGCVLYLTTRTYILSAKKAEI